MKKLIFFLLLTSCVSSNSIKNNEIFNFNDDLSFDQFNLLLKKYANNSPYPNINK